MDNNLRFNELFAKLGTRYRGLRASDLCPINPEYSCVICVKFTKCGKTGRSCPEYERIAEAEFAMHYNFEETS